METINLSDLIPEISQGRVLIPNCNIDAITCGQLAAYTNELALSALSSGNTHDAMSLALASAALQYMMTFLVENNQVISVTRLDQVVKN
jgi:hypothetical protein